MVCRPYANATSAIHPAFFLFHFLAKPLIRPNQFFMTPAILPLFLRQGFFPVFRYLQVNRCRFPFSWTGFWI
jgi:hypothetical protein